MIGKERSSPWHLPWDCNILRKQLCKSCYIDGTKWPLMGVGRRLLQTANLMRNIRRSHRWGARISRCESVFSVVSEWGKKSLYHLAESRFSAFEPYLDEIIMTQIHAQVEGIHISLKFGTISFWDGCKQILRMRKTTIFYHQYRRRKSNGRSMAEFLQLLCVICIWLEHRLFVRSAMDCLLLLWLNGTQSGEDSVHIWPYFR